MIATNRRMPAHDFLLVAFSVAVIVLSKWPETQPRQWVQLREPDGTLVQYSLAETDPTVAKLRLALEKWAKAGQETRLAVAQWRAELADFYAEKTESERAPSPNPIRSVAYRNGARQPTLDAQTAEKSKAAEKSTEGVQASQRHYWLTVGQQARAEIAKVQEIRRSRKALEVPPPIVFGPLEPGRKPSRAIMISPAAGVVVALAFAAWSFLCPTLQLSQQDPGSRIKSISSGGAASSRELRLVVPSNWVRIRQPKGVFARWGAMATLALYALVSVFF